MLKVGDALGRGLGISGRGDGGRNLGLAVVEVDSGASDHEFHRCRQTFAPKCFERVGVAL